MEVSGQLQAPAVLTPEPPVSIRLEAGWALQPVWVMLRRDKFCTARNQTLTVQLVARRYTA
jgi:hypothetical protein